MAVNYSAALNSASFNSGYESIERIIPNPKKANNTPERCPVLTSCRWMVAHVCFWGTAAMFTLRQSISMALVCMFPDKGGGPGDNVTGGLRPIISPNKSQQLDWSDEIQGLVLSAHFYGYLITPMFGGYLATRYGGKQVLAASMIISVIATLLTPVTALYSAYAVIALRVIVGLCMGPATPAMQEILNRWSPSRDKSKLLAYSYAGTNVGNVIAFGFSGILCTIDFLGGWPLVFYVFGCVSIFWILWLLLCIHNSPETHPRITEREKLYIRKGIPNSHKQKITKPPWNQVLTSLPLIACLLCQFVNASTQICTTVTLPLYMRDVLEYSVEQNGLFSALPPVGRFGGMLLSGYLSDYIVRKGLVSLTVARKLFLAAGYLIPAACLLGLSFLDKSSRNLAVFILILSATASASSMITLRVNITDIAPRYASVLVGALMTVNGIPGIIVPLGVTLLTSHGTREEWQVVFFIAVALYVCATIFYFVFGSAHEQSWAMYQPLESDIEENGDINVKNPVT